MVNPRAVTPSELNAGAASAIAAVATPLPLSLTLAAPAGAQQSPVAVNTEGTPSFGPYMFVAKFALNSIGLYCHSHRSGRIRLSYQRLLHTATHFKATNSP